MPEKRLTHEKLALVASAFVAAGGSLALLGWLIDSPVLKSGIVGLVPMNPLTALLFVASASVLALVANTPAKPSTRRAAFGWGSIVTLVALVLLARYLTPWDLSLDQILFFDRLDQNRMAPNTAIHFVLVGLALLTLHARNRFLGRISQAAVVCVCVGSMMSLVGYGYGIRHLYGIGTYIPMALNSSVLFAVFSLGLLCAQFKQSVFHVLASQDVGGVTSRRLLPAAVIIPIVLGFIRLAGQRAGLYDTEFGASLMVVVTVVLLVAAILVTADALSRTDQERKRAEATIRLYADIVRHIPIGLNIFRLEDSRDPCSLRFLNANPAASALLGVNTDQLLSRTILEAFPAVAEADLATYADVARDGQCREIPELIYGDQQVTRNIWSVKAFPLPDKCVGLAFENISQRKAAEEEIRKLNEELEQRVEQRTSELAEVNSDLLHKNQENEMFVYSVSHDLRSPLVSLQGFSRELSMVGHELCALLDNEAIPAEVRTQARTLVTGDMQQSLKFIQSGVLRLSNIIDALLRLSRVGRVEYEFRKLNVNEIVSRVVEAMSSELFERGVDVQLAELPQCHGDATAIEQVFANLIGNALKYLDKDRKGRIEVGAVPSPSRTDADAQTTLATQTFYVKDNGLGIAAAYQEKIFQAFQRVHTSHAPGDGMGLAIVRRIVQRHGGRAWVESAEGQGSTFFVTLPVGSPETNGRESTIRQPRGGKLNGERTDGDLIGGRR